MHYQEFTSIFHEETMEHNNSGNGTMNVTISNVPATAQTLTKVKQMNVIKNKEELKQAKQQEREDKHKEQKPDESNNIPEEA